MSDETLDPNGSYVYDGVEVVLTGRRAEKTSTVNKNLKLVMYEVEPKDTETIQWKKWVQAKDIYIIQ